MEMSMSMSTPMSSTVGAAAAATASIASSSSSTMDMSTSMTMEMVFTTSHTTPLYSSAWTPSTTTTYALTCLFLLLLAIFFRVLLAFKSYSERRWAQNARRHGPIVVVGDDGSSAARVAPYSDADRAAAQSDRVSLTSGEVNEKVRVVTSSSLVRKNEPWRLSVDLPRAALYVVIVGVGYLEMLAVMTMNVGYFGSVLGGAFLGELFVGRYTVHMDTHH